jgi:hypothetical protein
MSVLASRVDRDAEVFRANREANLELLRLLDEQLALARAGGALLVVVGLAMAAGAWTPLFAPLVRLFVRSGWPPI